MVQNPISASYFLGQKSSRLYGKRFCVCTRRSAHRICGWKISGIFVQVAHDFGQEERKVILNFAQKNKIPKHFFFKQTKTIFIIYFLTRRRFFNGVRTRVSNINAYHVFIYVYVSRETLETTNAISFFVSKPKHFLACKIIYFSTIFFNIYHKITTKNP